MAGIDYYNRIKQVYLPPLNSKKKHWQFADLVGHNNIRYFSYARYALLSGLKCIGVKKGDKILLPSFICKEVLSPISSTGAKAIFYSVDKKLKPREDLTNFPKCKAVIAVNYFGFPQSLRPFVEYCKQTGAVLIEDNAHGLFSRDEGGTLLGLRGDMGIFSFRKTLPLLNGAALVINDERLLPSLPPQIEFRRYRSLYFNCKELVRRLLPIIGIHGIKILIFSARLMKNIFRASALLLSQSGSERLLPSFSLPSFDLLARLHSIDIPEEMNRRNELYKWLGKKIVDLQGTPIFIRLPKNCVPYTFPFYASEDKIIDIKKKLNYYGLECFKWPDLPTQIKSNIPAHYNRVYCVRFLW